MCQPKNLLQDVTHFDCVWSYLNVHNPNWKSRKSMECWWAERRGGAHLTTGTNSQMEVFKWPTAQGRESRWRANLFQLRVTLLRRVQPVGQCADIRTVAYPWQQNAALVRRPACATPTPKPRLKPRVLTWKLSIDGKEVGLLYRAVHRV